MKKVFIILLFLSATIVSFTQTVIRDHRGGDNKYPGQISTTIEPYKWYYIKKAGTDKYMQIAGHKNTTKSYAILAAEDLQLDLTSQQWRFVHSEGMESNVYRLQNRKYSGFLFTAPFELYMEFKNDENPKKYRNALVLVPNSADKTWYILTNMSGSKKALSIWRHKSRHCMPAESEPLIGGRVLKDYECANEMTRNYVGSSQFTGQSDQKWILQEVGAR